MVDQGSEWSWSWQQPPPPPPTPRAAGTESSWANIYVALVQGAETLFGYIRPGYAVPEVPAPESAYTVVDHLTAHPATLGIFLNALLSVCVFVFNCTVQVVFGKLSGEESQALNDRAVNYTLFKVVFVGAILDPGLTGVFKWVSHYLILGTLRVLAYVSNERFETLSAIASVQRVDVMKIILLLIWINVCNAVWLRQCTFIFQGESFTSDNGANGEELVSWSIMFVILYESTMLMLESGKCLFKLAVHWLSVFSESSFQKKSTWIYYCELVTEVSAYAVTFGHYLHIWALCGISFTLVDAVLLLNLRAVFLSLTKCLEAHQRFRNAIMFLEHTYEEATGEERRALCDAGEVCCICLRDFDAQATKLLCGHYLHKACLRQWFERIDFGQFAEHTCPICREPLIGMSSSADGDEVHARPDPHSN